MAQILSLLVKCTTAIRDQLKAQSEATAHARIDSWFVTMGSDFYLKLPVDRNKYKRIENRQGSRLEGYVDIGDTTISTISTAHVGFEATIEDQHADIWYLLRKLAYDCTSPDLLTHTPLTILDFVGPEMSDRFQAGGNQFYTTRVGKVTEQDQGGTVAGKGSTRYNTGFTFKFIEQKRRRVL